ncbi:type II/IV secretion system protein [Anaerobacillus alkaliphilus]|uniref:Type II/IV secretion system protein n=1 Tax=Anaerobacillus alkaliphilus TaxID=1548597 RepID=A0A4Q0VQR1_9BACI|nr:competence type IV pilus ATPase ComGA [Anaerobacillus alkaliphilus]RXI99476.1 type II/IV secretion system protein [Anaerobacillus alkaliphilus]
MSSIERKSDEIVLRAVQQKASDIHIVPANSYSAVQFKINNRLVSYEKLKNSEAEKLISHFKFRSKMDIGERRRPQNGSLKIQVKQHETNLRLSTLPTTPHESLAIRVLPQSEITTLNQLSLFPNQTDHLRLLMKKAHGLLLVSGPTGSGKTTTIYSLLSDEMLRGRRIITIEDPIEKRNDAFIQVEINEKAGVTYVEALKATLRHDPDIIMIGEIRDERTAQIAIRAAMTGHLVISTIHATNCVGSISRLREFGCAKIDLKETIIGVVSQRLLTLKCPLCNQHCSNYCCFNQNKRLAAYEILSGSMLEMALDHKDIPLNFETLPRVIRKSIALGYVDIMEYERWLC